MVIFNKLKIFIFLIFLCGCQAQQQNGPVKSQNFRLADMAKSDIDLVAEVSIRHSNKYLRELAEKLYRRNPSQVKGSGTFEENLKESINRIFSKQRSQSFQKKRAADLIMLTFSENFQGDRIAAFISGIRDMQFDAYGGKEEFFLLDKFDPQKIYYLARNIEIASWRIRNKKQANGNLYLESVGVGKKGHTNASSERLFGKLISLHDHFAYVIAGTTNRTIKNVVQGLASAIFFPI